MIRILSISDSNKHFHSAIAEYKKRLGKDLEIFPIKPINHGTHQQIIKAETKKLLEKIQKEQKKGKSRTYILLSKEGEQISTKQFVKILGIGKKDITFIIGGPYGLDEGILENVIDKKIAFGSQTMPHGLAQLVLIEQIYRAMMIKSGRTYHL